MLGRREKKQEQFSFTFDDRYEEKYGTMHNRQDCSMCGDVGFPDYLKQCTRCHFRFQHTYCCNSTDGLETGVWMCSWCQVETAKSDPRGSQKPAAVPRTESSDSGGSAGALEFLVKAALTEAGVEAAAGTKSTTAGGQSASVGGGSFSSSNTKSVKRGKVRYGVDLGDASSGSSTRERISTTRGDEEATICADTHDNNGSCGEMKRNHKPLRSSMKSSQKRRNRSLLEQQCGSLQLKQLSSLKGRKSGIACNPPKIFVRHYKLLSDISF